MNKIVNLLICILTSSILSAQQEFNVTIIYDSHRQDTVWLQKSIKSEIESLLSSRYTLNFKEHFTGGDIIAARKIIKDEYSQLNTDVLVGAGIFTSQILNEQKEFPIPSIAALNINNVLVDKQNGKEVTSGIHNFTYIQSPFDIREDITLLSQITSIHKIALLVNPAFKSFDLSMLINNNQVEGVEFELIIIEGDPQATLNALTEDIDAIYVLSPLNNYSKTQSEYLFQGIADKKIPSLSLLDYPMLSYGAYAAFSSADNMQRLPRRIALNVSKIADGRNPKDFPVEMEILTRRLIINMETVNKTGVYPKWKILDNATLINVSSTNKGRTINLKSAIAEGLENNLGYQVAQKQTQIAQKELKEAKSKYLPQVDVSSSGLFLDEHSVNSSFGTKGEFNWSADASFSQLILSEPALANISIQKLLKDSQIMAEKQSELDVVLDVVTAYFNYHQVQSLVDLHNENVNVKQQNLSIAMDKESVGHGGKNDVFRWETELALARADFNDASAQLNTVRFHLNQTLNRPINEEFVIEQIDTNDYLSQIFDLGFVSIIENPGTFKVFADFMVTEALNNLPENKQIELALQAQQRLLKSKTRSVYSPSVVLAANYDYPINTVNPGEALPIPSVDMSIEPSWNVAVVASFPIFNGGSRRHQIQKSQIELYQLQDQHNDVRNKLEQQVRSNLEKTQTSMRNLQLNKSAARFAQKNVNIIQDLYNEGQISITSLIDAQNASLGAEINASDAMYQLIINLFALERSVGVYMSLATTEQRTSIMGKFNQYKNSIYN